MFTRGQVAQQGRNRNGSCRGLHRLLALTVSCLVACAAPNALAELRFFVMGDAPYSVTDLERLPGLLAAAQLSNPAFLAHIGDIKSGGSSCDDATLETIRELFANLEQPLVYSIGDNEWTDCHRASAGSYDPFERLTHVRQRFFKEPSTLRLQELQVRSAALPEIFWFEIDTTLFLNLHVVGSYNGHRLPGKAARRAFALREQANLELLKCAQTLVQRRRYQALVVFTHANSNLDTPNADPGFRATRTALLRLFESFGGPALLIHGDTHKHRIDRPVTGNPALPQPILTRLEVPGYPALAGILVRVRPGEQPPFRFSLIRPPDETVAH